LKSTSKKFPEYIRSPEDLDNARRLIESGYRHRLEIRGSGEFRRLIEEALSIIDEAGYGDMFRAYIRRIEEVDGFTQLREAEATLWICKYMLNDIVSGASVMVQKAYQMKRYLEGKPYYGPKGEMWTTKKRFEFLRKLRDRTKRSWVKQQCERLLREWEEPLVI